MNLRADTGDKLRGRSLQGAITFSCASCYLLFGYDQGVLGGLVAQPSFLEAIGNPSANYLGLIVALYNIGCLAGCVVAAFFGNDLGRKWTIIWGNVIMIVGAILQATTYGAPQLIAGRLISGVGNGMNTSTIPIYVAETAKSARRGTMVAVQLSVVIFGTVVAYWLDYGTVENLEGEVVWRFPIAFQIVFSIITLGTIIFLPDTPRWLYSHDRKAEAIDVLARLLNQPTSSQDVQATARDMEIAIQLEHSQPKLSVTGLLRDKSDIKKMRRLVLCFMIYFMQMFTGINVIAFYVTIVLEQNVGLTKERSALVAGCVQIVFWVGTFPPMVLLDTIGRRKLLMIGATVMCFCMTIFTIGISIDTPAWSRTALAALFIYEFTFGCSWNCTPWLYSAEITPLEIRHIGAATGAFSEWLFTFVIVYVTPTAIEQIGWRFYLIFIIMLALCVPFVYFFLPETAGKTLEELDYIFVKEKSLHDEQPDLELDIHEHSDKTCSQAQIERI